MDLSMPGGRHIEDGQVATLKPSHCHASVCAEPPSQADGPFFKTKG